MTIEEAKKIYFKYDCSLFAMAREEKDAYENYRNLKISRLIEKEWEKELLTLKAKQLKTSGKSELYNSMYDISKKQHDKEELIILKQALENVVFKDSKTIATVCETILGRKELTERSGMVFWAYDLGEREIARELLMFVWKLLCSHTVEMNLKARFERNIKKCCMIDSKLRLEVCN